jgi:hypothetical protein
MKTESTVFDKKFAEDIQHLTLLSKNDNTANPFMEKYQEMITEVYNEMSKVRNVDKVAASEYTTKAKMLQSIWDEQLRWLGFKINDNI